TPPPIMNTTSAAAMITHGQRAAGRFRRKPTTVATTAPAPRIRNASSLSGPSAPSASNSTHTAPAPMTPYATRALDSAQATPWRVICPPRALRVLARLRVIAHHESSENNPLGLVILFAHPRRVKPREQRGRSARSA